LLLIEELQYFHGFGFGAYHSGVQIGNVEYTYGSGAGIFLTDPKSAPGAVFRESIEMGSFDGSSRRIDKILDELRTDFTGSAYNILTRNCNHFADAFLRKILNKPIPSYVNRLAFFGSIFSCVLPPSLTGQAPVDQANRDEGGYRYNPLATRNNSVSIPGKSFEVFSGPGKKIGKKSK